MTGWPLVLELERDVHLGAVRLDLALGVELQIELDDLGDTEVAQGFSGAADRRGRGLFPGFLAGADQLDDLIDALRHVNPPIDVTQDAPAGPQPNITGRARIGCA